MSHLPQFPSTGYGKFLSETYHYVQAVRKGDEIHVSGQGGWDSETGDISPDRMTEFDQAFSNVERIIKEAGGKGWSQVYRSTVYLIGMSNEGVEDFVKVFKKWVHHGIVLNLIGVAALAGPGMTIEIEAVAHDA